MAINSALYAPRFSAIPTIPFIKKYTIAVVMMFSLLIPLFSDSRLHSKNLSLMLLELRRYIPQNKDRKESLIKL